MAAKHSIRFSFRIYSGEEPFIGPGRVQLMEGIRKYGSIAKAAESMGMSYRKAWQMVKDMNAVSKKPLVGKRLGGREGGGAFVTPEGENVMLKFQKLRDRAEGFFNKSISEMKL